MKDRKFNPRSLRCRAIDSDTASVSEDLHPRDSKGTRINENRISFRAPKTYALKPGRGKKNLRKASLLHGQPGSIAHVNRNQIPVTPMCPVLEKNPQQILSFPECPISRAWPCRRLSGSPTTDPMGAWGSMGKLPCKTAALGGYLRCRRSLQFERDPQLPVAEQPRGTHAWNLKEAVLSKKISKEENTSPISRIIEGSSNRHGLLLFEGK